MSFTSVRLGSGCTLTSLPKYLTQMENTSHTGSCPEMNVSVLLQKLLISSKSLVICCLFNAFLLISFHWINIIVASLVIEKNTTLKDTTLQEHCHE